MKFYLTFPQRNRELKDKYDEIEASSESDARQIAFYTYGLGWSMLYQEEGWIVENGQTQAERYELTLNRKLP